MMVARSHVGSNLESKVFTMSPEEENYRTKLRRVDSPDISTAVPGSGSAMRFTAPVSDVFTFTAAKNEHSRSNPVGTEGMSRRRCRVCNRPRLTKASSTTRKIWHLSADDNTGQVNPFSTRSVNFKQSESKAMDGRNLFSTLMSPDDHNLPVRKLEEADQIVKKASEMVKMLESHIAALRLSAQGLKTPSERMTPVQGIPMNLYSNFKDNEPVNPFKQTKLNFTGTSISPKPFANSCSQCSPHIPNFGPAITFPCQTPSPTPSPSYTPGQQQSPSITFPCQTTSPTQNLCFAQSQPQSPSITFPCQTPSPTQKLCHAQSQSQSPAITCPRIAPSPSLSHSFTPSQPQSPAITCPYHTQGPSPSFSYTPSQPQIPAAPSQILKPNSMQRVSSKHSQKTNTPILNVKNIVQRLESLSLSPSPFHKTPIPAPKYNQEFRFPPLQSQSELEKDNINRTPKKTGSIVSSSSGVNKHFKPYKAAGQKGISAFTRKAKLPTSKMIMSHRLPSHQQHSSHYEDDSGSSVSSSSWTTTQQSGSGTDSGARDTDAYDYSSSTSHPSEAQSSTTPESAYSTETTSSSSSLTNRRRLSISIPHGLTRRRSKKKPSVPNEKPISRLRKIKNKLGLIFHHHHHHHHHHDEEPKLSRKKLPVVRQPRETAAVKRRDQQGHFHALFGGLMRHVRSNKKKKSKPLKDIQRLKKKVQLGKPAKRRTGLKLPNINKKSKFKAVRK